MNRTRTFISTLALFCLLAACATRTPSRTTVSLTVAPPSTGGSARASAAGTGETRPDASPPAAQAWPSELFLARPDGATGPLLAYDMANGLQRFNFPAGLMSATGDTFYSADITGDKTTVLAYIPQTGALTQGMPFDGKWQLSAVSRTGRWLALTRLSDKSVPTEIMVVDSQSGKPAHQMSLDGNFQVDALSSRGDALFLIEYLPAVNPDHYQIRLYDFAAEKLQDGALVDKRAADEVMAGEPQMAMVSRDGHWHLTLYLRPKEHTAFIHALSLDDRFTFCIDLPSGAGDMEKLRAYTLALAPDDTTVYATNPAIGFVAKVSLNDLSVTNVAKFDPASAALQTPSRSLVSADGKELFFARGAQLWTYDIRANAMTSFTTAAPVASLGLSNDAQRLYTLAPDQTLQVLDPATGAALSFPTMATSQ